MMPSSKAAVLEVFHQAADDKPKKKVEDGQELTCVAGHLLTGLSMYFYSTFAGASLRAGH